MREQHYTDSPKGNEKRGPKQSSRAQSVGQAPKPGWFGVELCTAYPCPEPVL